MTEVHSCDELPTASTAVSITVENESSAWYLFYRTWATDQDVRAGEAEEVGESIGEVSIAIRYCPFCGIELPLEEPS